MKQLHFFIEEIQNYYRNESEGKVDDRICNGEEIVQLIHQLEQQPF